MADVITRFKLETTQYDSKLRDEAKRLAEFTRQAAKAGNEFGKFAQENVEAARALGSFTPSAKNAKDKVRELVGAINETARAYNSLTKEQQQNDFAKAMADSIGKLNAQLREAKKELYEMGDAAKKEGGGGLFSGLGDNMSGVLQVFGGNLMTKAAGLVASLGSEIISVTNESVALANQAEGVQMAFARLGDGSLLDGLREATHGTVSDFELMKAAVKFNDFKLPVEELGTMLAFAQQKAKDTGQSVDYMVDSIVTGLGRKSLMILDNLGLSASEVKEKMAETGDMTKAVGEIIREQMSNAGDYVETAADRATQANVELENAMLELGTAMRDTFGYDGWDSMAAGIKTELVGAIIFTIETINEAKRAWIELMQWMGVADKPQLPKPQVTPADGTYWEKTDAQGNRLGAGRYLNGKAVQTEAADFVVTGHTPTKTKRGGGGRSTGRGGGGNVTQEVTYASDSIAAQEKLVSELTKKWREAGASVRNDYKSQLDQAKLTLQEMTNPSNPIVKLDQNQTQVGTPGSSITGYGNITDGLTEGITSAISPLQSLNDELRRLHEGQALALSPEQWQVWQNAIEKTNKQIADFTGGGKDGKKSWEDAAGAVQAVGSAMQGIEDPAAKIMGTIGQAIATIALTFASSLKGTVTPWDWIAAAAAGTATMISTIAAIHSATGYANGGIVDGRGGGFVPGNTWSGDQVGNVSLDSGELVLSRAQQGNLASQLSEQSGGSPRIVGKLKGEDIVLMADRWGMRTGRGELLFGKNL